MKESEANEESAEDVQQRIVTSAGEADWHVSVGLGVVPADQAVVIRPSYDEDDEPWQGDVVLHAFGIDEDTVSEVELSLSAAEMARIARQYLAMLEADQAHYDRATEATEEEQEEEEYEEEE